MRTAFEMTRDQAIAVDAAAAAAQPSAPAQAPRGSWALQVLGLIFYCGFCIVQMPRAVARVWRNDALSLWARSVASRTVGHVIVLTLGAVALWAAPLAAEQLAAREALDGPGYYTAAAILRARTLETAFPDVMARPTLLETTVILRPRDEILAYEVRGNDTLVDIAARFRIDLDTLLWANDIAADHLLYLGDMLRVPPVDGVIYTVDEGDVLHEIAEEHQSNPVAIAEYNRIGLSTTLVPGMELIIPHGVLPAALRKSPAQTNLSEREQPVAAFGEFRWPAVGVITQRFHGYHLGLDIGNRTGTAIVAADAGQVIAAGWNAVGYGYRIVINHGNGWVTTYSHLSGIYVSVGDYVKAGDTIAAMGNTGYSTGPHLHFEVLFNNRFRDPLSVLN